MSQLKSKEIRDRLDGLERLFRLLTATFLWDMSHSMRENECYDRFATNIEDITNLDYQFFSALFEIKQLIKDIN